MSGTIPARMRAHGIQQNRQRLTRNRRVQACQQCRDSKVKCDRTKPSCQTCTNNNRPCAYFDVLQSSHASNNSVPTSSSAPQPGSGSPVHNAPKAVREDCSCDKPNDTTRRSRYISDVSWLCALTHDQPSLPVCVAADQSSVLPSRAGVDWMRAEKLSPEQFHYLFSPANIDSCIFHYEHFCYVWYPIVSPSETKLLLANCRDADKRDSGSAALTTAMCYIASKAARTSGHGVPSLLGVEEWQAVAQIMLEASGYPSKPSLQNVRAAFLLAIGDVAETRSDLSVAPTCILVRAAHLLGLHRDPSAYTSRSSDVEMYRTTWWAIHSQDMSFSVAHGVPPVIRPGSSDVRRISSGCARQHQLFATMVRVNVSICAILEDVYGIREPTPDTIERLDREVDRTCAEEAVPARDLHDLTASERFVVVSRRACCWKLKFVLHQPYLRSEVWPEQSRGKALDACKQYINDFLTGISDPMLKEYRWVFDHFNVFHACAIILRDLIQHAGSSEAQSLQETMISCFSNSFVKTDPNWAKLRGLADLAWHANAWPLPWDEPRVSSASSSWSLLCDPVFMLKHSDAG